MEDEGDASFDLSQISGRRRQVGNDRRRSSHNLRVYIPALSSLSLVVCEYAVAVGVLVSACAK